MKNKTNKSYTSYKTYKSHKTYVTYFVYAFLLSLFFSFFPQPALIAHAGVLSRPPSNLGLVGYWSMDEGVGNIVGDASGQRNTGTITGATWVNGKYGKALNFNGTNNYIYSSSSYASGTSFPDVTVSAWIKTTSASGKKIVGFESNQTGTASASYDRHLYVNTNGKAVMGIYDTAVRPAVSSSTVTTGEWVLVTGTFNDTENLVKIYINGKFESQIAASYAQSYTGYWRVGSYKLNSWTLGSDGYFPGSIDDVRVYNRALTANEVSNLYKAGSVKVSTANVESLPVNAVIGLVRQDCTGYTNCATSLSAWQTMMLGGGGPINWTGCTVGDLVCKNVTAVAKIDGPWSNPDTTPITINGWTTGSNNYIKIYTTSSARHDGKWNNSKYRLYVSDATAMNISEDYVNVSGLQVGGYGYTAHDRASILVAGQTNGSNKINISESILYRTHTSGIIGQGIYVTSTWGVVNVWNSVIVGAGDYNWSNRNACVYVIAGTLNIYNSTLITSYGNGLSRDGGTVTAKNVYAKASTNNAYFGTMTKINSASADSTGSLGFQNIAYSTANFVNVTAGSENLHLTVNSGLRNVGASTSGDSPPLNFSTDVDSQIRTGGLDIGADEYSEGVTIGTSYENRMTNGLVGFWTMNGKDYNSASTTAEVLDKSGQGNNGDNVGAVTTIGKVGQGLKFDGVNDYVNGTASSVLDFGTNSFSIQYWMKADKLPTGEYDNSGGLVSKMQSTYGEGWYTFLNTASRVGIYARYDLTNYASAYTSPISLNQWYHITFVINRSNNTIRIYTNGVLDDGGGINISGWGDIDAVGHQLRFGAVRDDLSHFGGSIDEVRVYNRALSPDEVKQLYNMGK